jgi:hypothetical protein
LFPSSLKSRNPYKLIEYWVNKEDEAH